MERGFVDAFRKDFGTVLALQVAHAAAARQRIPVTRPFVVVVSNTVHQGEIDEMQDVTAAVGAELIKMPDAVSPVSFFRIKKALIERLEARRPKDCTS